MKKSITVLLVYFLASSAMSAANEVELTDKQIEQYYNQVEKEAQNYKASIKAGTVIGGAVGAPLGYLGMKGLEKYDPGMSKMPESTRKNILQGITRTSGALGGGAVGGMVGAEAGANISAWHYANKYGVSRRVARAALLTKQPLSISEKKELFVAAEKRDNAKLQALLTNIAMHVFGQSWQETLKKNFALDNPRDYQFFKYIYLVYRLDDLYSNRVFMRDSYKTQLDRAQALLKKLNILA